MLSKIAALAYALGALAVLIGAGGLLLRTIKREKPFSARYMGEWSLAAVAFLLAFLPAYTALQCFTAPVPDGQYEVMIGVLPHGFDLSPMHLRASVSVYRDVEYEEYERPIAGVDHTGTRAFAYDYVCLDSVYTPEGEVLFTCGEVVDTTGPETISLDVGDITVDIGAVTKERLGISPADIWSLRSPSTKAWDIAPILACALLLLQHGAYLRKREE